MGIDNIDLLLFVIIPVCWNRHYDIVKYTFDSTFYWFMIREIPNKVCPSYPFVITIPPFWKSWNHGNKNDPPNRSIWWGSKSNLYMSVVCICILIASGRVRSSLTILRNDPSERTCVPQHPKLYPKYSDCADYLCCYPSVFQPPGFGFWWEQTQTGGC